MSPPAYLRSSSASSFHSASSTRSNHTDLNVTGLRRKKLCALFGCLGLLTVIAIFLFIMNIMLIVGLQMNQHGMRFLKFHTTDGPDGEEEKIVQFSGNSIDLGTVVANGKVFGTPDSDLNIFGSRVLVSGEENGTRLVLEDDGCRIENANNFQVISSRTGRPIFSAQHPLVSIDKRIKKISTSKIVTNKIRSPVDESLKITVENMSIRGNEAIRFDANRVRMNGGTRVSFNTSHDGSIHLQSARVFLGSATRGPPLSSSPALSASIDAYRVCICSSRPKIFLVPGNKPCLAKADTCN